MMYAILVRHSIKFQITLKKEPMGQMSDLQYSTGITNVTLSPIITLMILPKTPQIHGYISVGSLGGIPQYENDMMYK